jgi:hypothetical protein
MWKNCLERDRPQMTVSRMRIPCMMPRATNADTGYVMLIAFPLQQWLNERALMLRYTYIACILMTETECVYCPVRAECKRLSRILVKHVAGCSAVLGTRNFS